MYPRFILKRIATWLALVLLTATVAAPREVRAQDNDRFRYEQAIARLREAPDEYHRWIALSAAAKESFNQGDDANAKKFAEELEKLSSKYGKDWNYGNAVQDFNVVLGRLALKAGDVDGARKRLLAAGHSPGSPQMDSFGPNVSLARDLATEGEKTTLLEYFELCRAFWKMERGRLDQWKQDIEAGRIPDFGANLIY